ncbi:MAG: putative metal-binding motif-containing protein, partial [Deltaproteobacteria bacterium]|nr:putative metal-binding motif-containing protein [Deltaproteobacteria bacterium]
ESDADADGWMGCEGDCDDGDPSVYPSAFETVADGVDQDCDGGDVCYDDADGDGYGSAVTVVSADLDCADSGESSVSMDCDDAHADIHPDTAETCDGEDDDCDGEVDERDAVDATTWYADTDGDGYGDPEVTHTSCEAPTGYVADATDCDDSDPGVHPDAEEIVADGVDQDCDGTETCYLDFDRDGYGTSSLRDSSDLDCTGERESSVDTDCDDGDGGVHPGATERCDGDDDDCDGTTDEDDATDAATWYADADGDGYGDPAVTHVSCEAPPGYVAPGTDCDDADPGVHPDAMETCDDEDDDCDGTVDEACEDCGNGIDDDEDGLLDCEDGDCAGGEPCLETLCDDGEDGDDDGLADCDDDDCWGPGCHPAGARARVRSGRFEEVAVRAIERSRRTCEVVEVWEDDVEQRRVILHSVRGTVQVLPPGLVSWSATTARTTCAWSIASVSFGTTGRRLTWTAFGLGSGGRLYEDHPGQPVRNSLYVEPGCRLAADPWFLPTSVLALERRDSRIHVVGTFDTLRLWSSWGRLGIASAFGPLWYLENRTVSTTETSTWSATLPYSVMCGTDYRYGTTTTWHASGSLASGSVHSALP